MNTILFVTNFVERDCVEVCEVYWFPEETLSNMFHHGRWIWETRGFATSFFSFAWIVGLRWFNRFQKWCGRRGSWCWWGKLLVMAAVARVCCCILLTMHIKFILMILFLLFFCIIGLLIKIILCNRTCMYLEWMLFSIIMHFGYEWQHECHGNVIFILFFPMNSFCFINSLFGSGEL